MLSPGFGCGVGLAAGAGRPVVPRGARVRTDSDRAGVVLLSCSWGGCAGQAGAGSAQSRWQQMRNASFQGQSGLIFRMRCRA